MMLRRALVVGFTVVALLAFSTSSMASPSKSNGVEVNEDSQIEFSNETAGEATRNPMDVPGIK